MANTPKSNNLNQRDNSSALKRAKRNIYRQAGLAGLMILLMVVILFAITAAWYTNIVQTSNLVFETSTWGFDGTVTLGDDPIQAAPGDEGVIELTAVSDSDTVTSVSVRMSKAVMSTPMQQRLYFYVDTPKARNGEIMERVYLNDSTAYTYTMFARDTLTLTEAVHNDALLKWHWVYDVLGYYVRGTQLEDGTVLVQEYLRPIEYDYDEATTTFEIVGDETFGRLTTVDGKTTPEQFLVKLSQTDGYLGTIDTQLKTKDGYYPVELEVDAEGTTTSTGVWAYLCDYSEIMSNIAYDTQLGQDAAANSGSAAAAEDETGTEGEEAAEGETGEDSLVEQCRAILTITAQNSNIQATEVSTPAGLAEALAEAKEKGESSVIRLTDDIVLTDKLAMTQMQQVMLDLNGKTMTINSGAYADKSAGIQLTPGSTLTAINGTIQGTDDVGYLISASGAEIAMSNVNFAGADCFLYVRDDDEDENGLSSDSKIRLVGCTVDTAEEAIYLSGNGAVSAQKTQLIVENSTIDSGYIGIMGNGNATAGSGQWGTDIQIINSTVQGKWAGVYHPQKDSVLTVTNGSTIIGYTGMAIKGGTVKIVDSTVNGVGETAQEPSGALLSGFCDTADGVYIEANYGYEIVLEIWGETGESTITSAVGHAVRVYPAEADNVSVKIYSGVFSSDVSQYLVDGANVQLIDGAYVAGIAALDPEEMDAASSQEAFTYTLGERTGADAESAGIEPDWAADEVYENLDDTSVDAVYENLEDTAAGGEIPQA